MKKFMYDVTLQLNSRKAVCEVMHASQDFVCL